jgi:hypothetical protein
MVWSAYKTKLSREIGRETKRVAEHREPPVVIPVILVLVHVHFALAVPAIEVRIADLYEIASIPPPHKTLTS